jgi:hypothetical protein
VLYLQEREPDDFLSLDILPKPTVLKKGGFKMKKIMTSITFIMLLASMCFFPTNAQALVPIFVDHFDIAPSDNGWFTLGTVVLRNPADASPAGNPVALLRAEGIDIAFMARSVSTVGFEDIEFSYYRKTANLQRHDSFFVGWKKSSDPLLDVHILESVHSNSPWTYKSWSLGPEASDTSIDIGFLALNLQGARARGWVDEVTVAGNVIPEPASLSLFGAGLVGLLGGGIKRKKQRT